MKAHQVINHRIQSYFVPTSTCGIQPYGVTNFFHNREVLHSMKSQMPTRSFENRAGERGAALLTAVLLSMLLLAAGGTLVLTTTMTSITARDATAEMQAYYAAEAGVAKTLEVLRGNVQSSPSGTRATFHNVVCSKSLWTATSGSSVNV